MVRFHNLVPPVEFPPQPRGGSLNQSNAAAARQPAPTIAPAATAGPVATPVAAPAAAVVSAVMAHCAYSVLDMPRCVPLLIAARRAAARVAACRLALAREAFARALFDELPPPPPPPPPKLTGA
ncbi:MAG TPA: hypothetical protein ENJ52_00820 [Aliiroseovarius sp.]|nr:hypothetical protein [Aliiroseovarius sp.]